MSSYKLLMDHGWYLWEKHVWADYYRPRPTASPKQLVEDLLTLAGAEVQPTATGNLIIVLYT